MEFESFLPPSLFAPAPRALSRTPAISRSKRSVSTSTASTSSIPSPTILLTPKLTTPTYSQTDPDWLDTKTDSRWPVGDVFRDDGRDFAGSELARVLNLTPRLSHTSFTPPLFLEFSDNDHACPDVSPLLGPMSEWVLPPVPQLAPIRMVPSYDSLLDHNIRSSQASIRADSITSAPSTRRSIRLDVDMGQEETMVEARDSRHSKHPSVSDGSSFISRSSVSSGSSTRPTIPDRTSSRKRPGVSSRVSSLPSSSRKARPPPLPLSTLSQSSSRRGSADSIVSAVSVLDPFPALPSASAHPLAGPSSHSPVRARGQRRSISFTSTPRHNRCSSVDFSAILFSGLTEIERHHTLHRTRSAPHLRSPRTRSSMPSNADFRLEGAPRTPKAIVPSRKQLRELATSPSSPTPNSRSTNLFSLDLFSSPKPSPAAIEHVAEPHAAIDGTQTEIAIPLYTNTLSPRTVVRLRPITAPRHNIGACEDIYSECKKADKLKALIAQAAISEAELAIKEAEQWAWARPPHRDGQSVRFADVRPAAAGIRGHGREMSGASTSSAWGSDMGLSESHSVETINEEDPEVTTPNSSVAFLGITSTVTLDLSTPSATIGPISHDATPKVQTPSGTLIRRVNSQNTEPKSKGFLVQAAALAFASEPRPQKPKAQKSHLDLRGQTQLAPKQQKETVAIMAEEPSKGGWKGSLGRSAGKGNQEKEKKEKEKEKKTKRPNWSMMELTAVGAGGF